MQRFSSFEVALVLCRLDIRNFFKTKRDWKNVEVCLYQHTSVWVEYNITLVLKICDTKALGYFFFSWQINVYRMFPYFLYTVCLLSMLFYCSSNLFILKWIHLFFTTHYYSDWFNFFISFHSNLNMRRLFEIWTQHLIKLSSVLRINWEFYTGFSSIFHAHYLKKNIYRCKLKRFIFIYIFKFHMNCSNFTVIIILPLLEHER